MNNIGNYQDIGRVRLSLAGITGHILDISIHSKRNSYAAAKVRIMLDSPLTMSQMGALNDQETNLYLEDGSLLFSGICASSSAASISGYMELEIKAYSRGYLMDKKKKRRTFQDPAKDLQTVADDVASEYGAAIQVEKNVPLPQIETQDSETDWAFLQRLANKEGMNLYDNITAPKPFLVMGSLGTGSCSSLSEAVPVSVEKNIEEYQKTEQNHPEEFSGSYEFLKETIVVPDLTISAGYLVGNLIVQESRIINRSGLLLNLLTIKRKEAEKVPYKLRSTGRGKFSAILTGTVLAVEGTNVKVHFQVDESQAEAQAMWMPYENTMNNYFYCMPDEGDKVFCYYDSEGSSVCLGSIHENTGNSDFSDYSVRRLTSQDEMIRFGKEDMEFVAGREEADKGGSKYSRISFDLTEGIKIHSDKDITIDGKEDLVLSAGKAQAEGNLSMYAVEEIDLKTGESSISIDNEEINVKTPMYVWEGFVKESGYEHIEDEYQDWFEVGADILQMGLDIIGMTEIPIVSQVADLASGLISLARGDYVGFGLSLVGMIPLVGSAATAGKMGKTAQKVAKTATKAIKGIKNFEKIYDTGRKVIKTVELVTMGLGVLRSINTDYEIMKRILSGEFDPFNNAEDASLLLSSIQGKIQLASAAKRYKKNKAGKKSQGSDNKTKSNNTQGDGNGSKHCVGDPIDVVTGSMSVTYIDSSLYDMLEPFDLKRIYESVYTNKDKMLGCKWMFNMETCIEDLGEEIVLQMEDMHLETFAEKKGESGTIYENKKPGNINYLLKKTEEGYEVKDTKQRRLYRYNRDGKLTERRDRFGNQVILTYQGKNLEQISLSSGQYLKFGYENGKVQTVTDTLGKVIRYGYEGELLTQVTFADCGSICYDYTPEGYLSSITDQNGITYVTNEYDRKGRVIHQTSINGEEYIQIYNDKERKNVFLRSSDNSSITYEYNGAKLPVKITYSDGTWEETGYDASEHVVYRRDRKGAESWYTYSQQGDLIRETLPNGLITEWQYDSHGNPLWEKDNDGKEIYYEYDRYGNLSREKVKVKENQWQETSYEHDRYGRLLKTTDALGNATKRTYETNFNLPTEIIGAEGEYTRYSYDRAGRNMEVHNIYGTTAYGYNSMDLCMEEIWNGNIIKRYSYDNLGNLIRFHGPNDCTLDSQQVTISYEYDAFERLVKKEDALGNIQAVCRDKAGNIQKAVHPNTYSRDTKDGEGIVYEYDTDGNCIRIFYPDGGIVRMWYDACGNLIKRVEPEEYRKETDDGAGYTYEYDCMNHLVSVTNPYGIVEKRYVYDLKGNIVKEIDAKGMETGNNDAERIGTLYLYNKAGWLLEKRVPITYEEETGKVCYELTAYEYDILGNVIQEKKYQNPQTRESAVGKVLVLYKEYDKSSRLVRVSDSLGGEISYGYDELGQKIWEKKKISGETFLLTRYVYEMPERISRMEEFSVTKEGKAEKLAITQYTYDKTGNLIKITTPKGNEILREYDKANRLVAETHREKKGEICNTLRLSYDAADNLIREENYRGEETQPYVVTEYQYDLLNRETAVTYPDGGQERKLYDRNGRLKKLISPNAYRRKGEQGEGKVYEYDRVGRLVRAWTPEGNLAEENTYGVNGEILRKNSHESSVSFSYDFGGRQREAVTKSGSGQKFTYDARGNITGVTDGNGNRTEYELDSWGRITAILHADGSREEYAYDYGGNITATTDENGNTISYGYDARGQVVKITDQTGESETFRYDSEGNQISHVDRNGTKISMAYNMYGSLVRRTAIKAEAGDKSTEDKDLSRSSESFFYYPDGRLKTAIAGGMRYEYTYDVRGRLKSKSASGKELISYGYDLNGNKTSQRDVTGNVTEYKYGISDELLEIYDKGVLRASYEYNPDGTLKRQKTGNGTEILTDTCYAYDGDRNLIGLKTFLQGGWQKDYKTEAIPLVCNAYGYDRNGSRIFKETIGGRTEYEYDSRNRLEMVRYPDRWEKFGYDPAGNRKSRVTGEVEENYTYDVRNRLLQVVRTAGNGVTPLAEGIKAGTAEDGYGTVKAKEEVWRYEYDRQGNLLKDNYAEYSYDGFNRMEKAETFSGKIQVNHYDAEGLRHEIEENGKLVSFIFSDREVVAETEKESTIRYILGYDILCSDSECARTYYHYVCDEGGSTSHILDETGKVLNQYEYDAFGNLIKAQGEVNNRFLYVGQQYDAVTMQYYLRARYYNPVVARFTQEDTYRGDGLNLYAYCRNNPVGYYDPSGNSPCPNKGGKSKANSNPWTRNLTDTSQMSQTNFNNLKNKGKIKVNSSGSNRPEYSDANSYYSTGNGEHIFIYDENGKLIYDLSAKRVKSFKINVDPKGKEHFQPYKLTGGVPQFIKNLFGW